VRVGGLRGEEGAGEVGVEDQSPLLDAVVLGRLADVGSGVVDEYVQTPEPLGRSLHHGAARFGVAQVEMKRQRTELARRGGILVLIATSDGDGGARVRQRARHGEADAAVAAGYQRRFPAQIEVIRQ
jgi:hypothetical protein